MRLIPRKGIFAPPVEFALRHHAVIREVAPASHAPEVAHGGRKMMSVEAKHALTAPAGGEHLVNSPQV